MAAENLSKPAIQSALAAKEAELARKLEIERSDTIEGIMASIDMGRMQRDPAAVRMGWVEIGKILGHYAPEVKKMELSMDQGRLRSKFEAMSDDELLAIEEGRVL